MTRKDLAYKTVSVKIGVNLYEKKVKIVLDRVKVGIYIADDGNRKTTKENHEPDYYQTIQTF
jgi:hypothetical protein